MEGVCAMKLSSVQRAGGISLIAGSLLLTAYSLCFFTLLPFREMRIDYVSAILNPHWIMIALIAFIGVIAMLFGFTAAYSRLYEEAGLLGLVGYICVEIAYLLQACKVTWELCLYPVIAGNEASVVLFKESILKHSQLVVVFRSCATVSIFLGITLFCITLVRSKSFPRSAGILIFIGALLYGLGPMLSVAVAMGGIIVLSIGCLQVGLRLILQNGNAPGVGLK
jgi:hypothetical protein